MGDAVKDPCTANGKAISKGGFVKSFDVTDEDMRLVNEQALEPLDRSQAYLFGIVACDNEIDRTYEAFDDAALGQLAKLYVGRTIIKDHELAVDNQFARIYSAEVIEPEGRTTSDGRQLKQLFVKAYMLDTAANAAQIADIKAGIKREVSVSFMPESIVCSICGTDNRREWCSHYGGVEYGGKQCHFTLSDISDAYELSFVAVPAQRGAGTKKGYLLDAECEAHVAKAESAESRDSEALAMRMNAARAYVNLLERE